LKTISVFASVVFIALHHQGFATVTTSGNFNTGSPTATFALTSDLVVPILNTGMVGHLAFDEWVSSDGSTTGVSLTIPQNVSYQINSGPVNTVSLLLLVDNLTFNINGLTANDGYLRFDLISVTAGDVLTFKAATFTFQPLPAFNSALPATFNGLALATDYSGNVLGEALIIPEPSSAMLCALVLPAWLIRRKRA
jgi:hypothetical protein